MCGIPCEVRRIVASRPSWAAAGAGSSSVSRPTASAIRRIPPEILQGVLVLHVTNGDSTTATMEHAGITGDLLPWRDVLHEGPVPQPPDDELRRVRAEYLQTLGPDFAAEVEAELRARDERLAAAIAGGRAGRPVVRARPLRPAPADPDPRRAARPPRARRADLHRDVPRPPGLPRPRRARARRAHEPVAAAHRGDARARPPRARGVGRAARRRSARARARGRHARRAPAVPRARAQAPARGAPRHPRRPRPHRAPAAAGGGRRRDEPRGRVPGEHGPRGGAVHGRHDRLRPPRRAATGPGGRARSGFGPGQRVARPSRPRSPATPGPARRCSPAAPTGSSCWASTAGSVACTCARTGRCGAGTTREPS